MTADEALNLAAVLLARPVRRATAVRRGGNNRIFAIDTDHGRVALKCYPPQAEDRRDRLGQEWAALSFLTAHGLPVPAPLVADPARHVALHQWIDGQPAMGCAADGIPAMAALFARLQDLRACDGAAALPAGSTPVLTAAQAMRQFRDRLAALDGIAETTALTRDLAAAAARAQSRARARLGAAFDHAPPPSTRVLSPSDFGLHNMLATPTGMAFVDFEYFGWDGPEKAIADAMLHPGSAFTAAEREAVRRSLLAPLSAGDPGLAGRLDAMLPLFALIWCLILLNEFRPDRRARRGLAAGTAETHAAQTRQLDKARALLNWLETTDDFASA